LIHLKIKKKIIIKDKQIFKKNFLIKDRRRKIECFQRLTKIDTKATFYLHSRFKNTHILYKLILHIIKIDLKSQKTTDTKIIFY